MGWLVDKIIILSLRVGTSKNKNIDHRGIETCAYKSDFISLLCDSTMSSAINLCFLSVLLKPKEKYHIRRNINGKKKNICEISIIIIIIIILICQKLGSIVPVEQKIKLRSPIAASYRIQSTSALNICHTYRTDPVFWIPSLYSDQLFILNRYIVTRNSSVLIVL